MTLLLENDPHLVLSCQTESVFFIPLSLDLPVCGFSQKYHCSVSETQARQLSPVIDSISSVSF